MKINSAIYQTSYGSASQYLQAQPTHTLPQICVVGRSNVGKSSFINRITNVGKLARTSSTPGRTRLINLFEINKGEFTLVDLPGYGYAKAGKREKEAWDELIGCYFENSDTLAHVFVLVDLRIPPTALDKQMTAYLYHYGLSFTVVATKADKLSKAQQARARQVVAAELGIGKDNIIVFSSESGQGKEAVYDKIESVLSAIGEQSDGEAEE